MSTATSPVGRRRPGRPPCCPPEVAVRVLELRRQGLSYAAISTLLNEDGVPTPTGRPRWQRSYVDRLLHAQHVVDLIWEDDN
jgi:Recombinase